MKDTLEEIDSILVNTEEWISDLEDKIVVITLSGQQNEKERGKKNEDSIRDLWDNIKCTNIRIIGILEGEDKKEAGRIIKK